MGRIVGYLRVSSRSQDAATQRNSIERAAAARGDEIEEWYSETASGKDTDRVALKAMRQAAREGEIARLYVYKLDRLTRSGIRDTLALIHELTQYGVQLVSIADGVDPSGPMGELVIAVLAWAAQIERAVLGERITAARERMREEGKAWGRPKRVSEAKLEKVTRLLAQGKSVRVVAQHVGLPRSTVSRIRVSQKPPPIPGTKNREKRPKYLREKKGG